MERDRVAEVVRDMIEPGGAWVHVHATTHRGADDDRLPAPAPPHEAIDELVSAYLGPVRRAGRGTLPYGTPSGEEEVCWRLGSRPHGGSR